MTLCLLFRSAGTNNKLMVQLRTTVCLKHFYYVGEDVVVADYPRHDNILNSVARKNDIDDEKKK